MFGTTQSSTDAQCSSTQHGRRVRQSIFRRRAGKEQAQEIETSDGMLMLQGHRYHAVIDRCTHRPTGASTHNAKSRHRLPRSKRKYRCISRKEGRQRSGTVNHRLYCLERIPNTSVQWRWTQGAEDSRFILKP